MLSNLDDLTIFIAYFSGQFLWGILAMLGGRIKALCLGITMIIFYWVSKFCKMIYRKAQQCLSLFKSKDPVAPPLEEAESESSSDFMKLQK